MSETHRLGESNPGGQLRAGVSSANRYGGFPVSAHLFLSYLRLTADRKPTEERLRVHTNY